MTLLIKFLEEGSEPKCGSQSAVLADWEVVLILDSISIFT